jgi:hypothetical protein
MREAKKDAKKAVSSSSGLEISRRILVSASKRRRAACHRTCHEGARATRPRGLSSKLRVCTSQVPGSCVLMHSVGSRTSTT